MSCSIMDFNNIYSQHLGIQLGFSEAICLMNFEIFLRYFTEMMDHFWEADSQSDHHSGKLLVKYM